VKKVREGIGWWPGQGRRREDGERRKEEGKGREEGIGVSPENKK